MRAVGMTESLGTEIALFALVGLGFNLLLGYTGLLSFGHGLFFGFAAYAAALSQRHWFHDSLIWPVVFAVVATALLGLIVGFFALRRRGVYFSLLTLAFTALAFFFAFRWTEFTGGESGLRGVARPLLGPIDLNDQAVFYVVAASVVFAAAWVLLRIVRSPFGSVLVAIRENEQRALFAGYPVRHYKLVAFVISATLVGVAGSLFAFLKSIVSADTVHVSFSGEIVAMTIIGGTRNFLGPALGALFYILFRELLSSHTDAWMFWLGLLFMAFILYSPAGLIGLGTRLWTQYRQLSGRLDTEAAAMAGRRLVEPGQAVPAFLCRPGAGDTVVLECGDVSKRFGEFAAVDRASLRLEDRCLHALIGPNGAGKTTLFNVISGLYPADGGTIALRGQRIDALSADRVARLGLARSFQITNLFPALPVAENLRLACQARDPARFAWWRPVSALAQVRAETAALIRFLGLEGLEQVPVSSLSYGGQRLLEIGVPLAARPRVLLLDEPLAGLAAAERERIAGLIRSLVPQMAILLVEHDMDRVFQLADRITAMSEGRVIAEGPPADVRANAELQRVYLGDGAVRAAAARVERTGIAAAPIIEVEAINTFYGKSHVLHDVSFRVRENEVVALLGRNGAGKTSTFKSIMGLVPPASGRVLLGAARIDGKPPERIARLGVGLVPQGRRLFSGLTVAENLALGALRRDAGGGGVHWTLVRVFEIFPRLRDRMQVKADRLSGGEQQMVAIARALSGSVRVLLLDEPFEGLSPTMVDEVFAAIEQLRRQISIVIIEHHLDLVLALADRAVVLDRGHVSHEGPSQPLLNDLDFRKKVLWI
ncbi:MAG: branched-chain amino acid ABC transporter ATP-binding protein/permease [Pseudomonadota bacterium]|nr:branched-chain amino acid ABC transporter ATP-binding protein/permease [Pseudomonadota bacterium]